MKGLILEMALESGFIAIADQTTIVDYRRELTCQNSSHSLHLMLQELLEANKLKLSDLVYVGFGKGPGSYTGTRVASVVSQMIAFSSGLKRIAFLSPLAYLPAAYEGAFSYAIDAKAGEFYLVHGVKKGNILSDISHERVKNLSETPTIGHSSELAPELNLPLIAQLCYTQVIEGSEALELIYFR